MLSFIIILFSEIVNHDFTTFRYFRKIFTVFSLHAGFSADIYSPFYFPP